MRKKQLNASDAFIFLPKNRQKRGEKMAGKYKFMTFNDRIIIAWLWAIGTRPQDIAKEIGVNPATLYRELKRGYPGKDGRNQRPAYNPVIAQQTVNDGISRRGRPTKHAPRVGEKGVVRNETADIS